MHVLILAGGGGTRLWPLSKYEFPKQFLRFNDPFSLLQKTVLRFLQASFVDSIVVLTQAHYEGLVQQQLKRIDPTGAIDILIEPAQKNTAPAIALGVKYLQELKQCDQHDPILVIPSDHLIEPESVFLAHLEESGWIVRRDRFVLFGIRPSMPETGYGYIQIGKKEEGSLYQVRQFIEKPELSQAEQYLESGDFYWNAGIFAFSPKVFWDELNEHAQEVARNMQFNFQGCVDHFANHRNISIDFALIEKTKNALVCPLPISWSDIGCWDSVYEVLGKDDNFNVKTGNVLDIETKSSLIMGHKKLISTIGLEDLLIVDTEEATFISKRGESQKVKELVLELKKRGAPHANVTDAWGNVKQIYKEDGVRVFLYTLWGLKKAILTLSSEETIRLIVLKGCVQHDGIDKTRGEFFEIEGGQNVGIENRSDEQAHLLAIYGG